MIGGRRLAQLAQIPVSELKGVGDKTVEALALMEIETVLDLLTHYPRRYLDRTQQATIRELKDRGTTILLVEQNAAAALSLADMAYVIETGRIVLSGTGPELMQEESVRKVYLGED